MKPRQQFTPAIIKKLHGWATYLKTRSVWTKSDEKLLNFLREAMKKPYKYFEKYDTTGNN
jgi:hypothetical protein